MIDDHTNSRGEGVSIKMATSSDPGISGQPLLMIHKNSPNSFHAGILLDKETIEFLKRELEKL